MKIAVIQSGSKKYKVTEGQKLLVDKLVGKKEKDKLKLTNLLDDKKVDAMVLGEEKDKKVIALKFRNKNRYHKKIGHRQVYSKILIEKIA